MTPYILSAISQCSEPSPLPQIFSNIAVMTHTSFSVNPKELNKFIDQYNYHLASSQRRARLTGLYTIFNTPTATYLIPPLLRTEIAQAQTLSPLHALAEDPYVLPCLNSLCNFSTKIEDVFADRNTVEDTKRALYSCKQGNLFLDVFNSLFSFLVYAFDLTEPSRIDI
ncbi:hypothetical protein MJO29_013811 [Puccinia striiformis f. sp. tritici]|nr:hypothetical protein MJO29_013811 [Puccinia striiformis f. sp. tritici]